MANELFPAPPHLPFFSSSDVLLVYMLANYAVLDDLGAIRRLLCSGECWTCLHTGSVL